MAELALILFAVVVVVSMVVGLLIAVVAVARRRSARTVLPDLAPGSRVVSTGAHGEVTGTLVRTDNAHAVIQVNGTHRFVPRDSLRPAFDRVSPDPDAPPAAGTWSG